MAKVDIAKVAADKYQKILEKEGSGDALAQRKQKAGENALTQAQNLAGERLSKAQSAARKQGMTRAQAASYAGAQANQNIASDYQNMYQTNLAQENLAAQQAMDTAKAQYDLAMAQKKDIRDTWLGVATSILGILSDERLKVIYDKWTKEARK